MSKQLIEQLAKAEEEAAKLRVQVKKLEASRLKDIKEELNKIILSLPDVQPSERGGELGYIKSVLQAVVGGDAQGLYSQYNSSY